MRTFIVLIFVMGAYALAIALILEPRWVLRKMLSPLRTFVLRAHRILVSLREIGVPRRSTNHRSGPAKP